MEEHGLSWVFNALALLTDYVRDYVVSPSRTYSKIGQFIGTHHYGEWAPL